MIALAVAAELETANPSVFASVGEVPSPDVWIDLHILQFELVEDHGSVVTLEYRVTNAHSQELLNEGRLSKRSVQGAPGVTQAIDELKRLLGELASEIGTGI